MLGLTLSSIKKNPSLIPLYSCFFAGFVASMGYLFRLATKNPDVSWNHAKNPEPWNHYENKQYKLYATEEQQKAERVQIPKY